MADDLNLVSDSFPNLLSLLHLVNEFFTLHSMKIQGAKTVILTSQHLSETQFPSSIKLSSNTTPVTCFHGGSDPIILLGAHMHLDSLPAFIPAWNTKVAQLHKTFSSKPMTSSILKYMFNQYFLPSIMYRTYGNALDEHAFDKHILSPLLPAIKHRLKLPSTAPNHLLFHSDAYALKHPF